MGDREKEQGLTSAGLVPVPRGLSWPRGLRLLLGPPALSTGVWALAWSGLLPPGPAACLVPPPSLFLTSLPCCKLGFFQSGRAGLGWMTDLWKAGQVEHGVGCASLPWPCEHRTVPRTPGATAAGAAPPGLSSSFVDSALAFQAESESPTSFRAPLPISQWVGQPVSAEAASRAYLESVCVNLGPTH